MTTAEVARGAYVEAQIRLDVQARRTPAGMPITAATIRNYARIAWRAARAELDDPEPDAVRPCPICRGVEVCNLAKHFGVGWPR
jgi:hypothetical protein